MRRHRAARRIRAQWVAIALLLGSSDFAFGGDVAITETAGSLVTHLDAILDTMPAEPGGGQYHPPAAEDGASMASAMAALLTGDFDAAVAHARRVDYEVLLYTDTDGPRPVRHAVLQRAPGDRRNWWGTYVVNPEAERPHLVIQSPHPLFDTHTGYQSTRVYARTGARAFFVAGTHRCNGIEWSPCDGVSSVCEDEFTSFRHSDVAHAVDSLFQIATEVLLSEDPEAVVVQLHGFTRREGDPHLILSNGTWFEPSGTDHAARLGEAMRQVDASLSVVVAHLLPGWTRLIGATNVQGRPLNGSTEPCHEPAILASGHFLHVEQAHEGLRDLPGSWLKIGDALMAIFPAHRSAHH